MSKHRALILDRDGVLIEDKNYAYKIEDLQVLTGVIKGLKLLQKCFLFFIVTNQSGIGKGYYSIQDFKQFNDHLINILKQNNINIEKTFYCPHLKEEKCECRKPNQKFMDLINNNWNIDLKKSWMIGDHPSDMLFGSKGGCNTIYLTTGHGKKHLNDFKNLKIEPDFISDNFYSAAKHILRRIT